MKIIFSTASTGPVNLTHGTIATKTVFTTKLVGGKNLKLSGPIAIPVASMDENDQIEVAFQIVVSSTDYSRRNRE
jgi:hypothetical protein